MSTLKLKDHQKSALERMRNGCILNGDVGSGKSITGLAYYHIREGGTVEPFTPMKKPRDLYIITEAKKRDEKEWDGELRWFNLSTGEDNGYNNKVIVNSWQMILKYANVKGAFFIFDEDRVTGSGAWVKAFLKIAQNNEWIILSATPGDCYADYIPVFIANGFFKNKTEFCREHVIYSRFTKYPSIERYLGTNKLLRLKESILVDMDFERTTVPHHEDRYVRYDIPTYKDITKTRWNPYEDRPIQNASELCYLWRRVVNSDEYRQVELLQILEDHPKAIIFYNFDYELDILKNLGYAEGTKVAEYNGHRHDPLPVGDKWVYLVNYAAGNAGWNCITTDTIIFYSQNYSYKVMKQASGRINRLNTPYTDLWYFHLKSRSGIDLAISRALKEKKQFNESRYVKW